MYKFLKMLFISALLATWFESKAMELVDETTAIEVRNFVQGCEDQHKLLGALLGSSKFGNILLYRNVDKRIVVLISGLGTGVDFLKSCSNPHELTIVSAIDVLLSTAGKTEYNLQNIGGLNRFTPVNKDMQLLLHAIQTNQSITLTPNTEGAVRILLQSIFEHLIEERFTARGSSFFLSRKKVDLPDIDTKTPTNVEARKRAAELFHNLSQLPVHSLNDVIEWIKRADERMSLVADAQLHQKIATAVGRGTTPDIVTQVWNTLNICYILNLPLKHYC